MTTQQYAQTTENTQGVAGASPTQVTPTTLPSRPPCSQTTWDWVPNTEAEAVPPQFRTLCQSCPGLQTCLTKALQHDASGYWAGSTTRQRKRVRELPTIEAMLAQISELNQAPVPHHEPGKGSERRYKAGCHCTECRKAHTATRRKERSRARSARAQVRAA